MRLHACLLAGARAVPVDPRLSEQERAALGDAPGDLVVHTSGTTGTPQPVGLATHDIEANARGTAAALGLTDDERWLCPLPLSHVGGLMVLLRSAVYGTTAVHRFARQPGTSRSARSCRPSSPASSIAARSRRRAPCCSAARPPTRRC